MASASILKRSASFGSLRKAKIYLYNFFCNEQTYSDNNYIAAGQYVFDTFIENVRAVSVPSPAYKPKKIDKFTGPFAEVLKYPMLTFCSIATSPLVYLYGFCEINELKKIKSNINSLENLAQEDYRKAG